MTESAHEYTIEQRRTLLQHARASIRHGLDAGGPLLERPTPTDAALLIPRASFVTLHREARLRGCIGELEARYPLIESVAHNAWAAAFNDPRFPPLQDAEFASLDIHISVLSPSTPIDADSESALLAALRPGIDGIVLQQGSRRSTFLPQVWEQIPSPAAFLQQLRLKAGLPAHYDPGASYLRYTVEAFGAE
ncbi:AmmeMemoRadiSam system protein A [Sinimarinibacterium sp. CAU 1509]|uniref:AmmeMemoRadiSam system protein A n=1 Tax=Sinimarinibacterium sp. CAU 1509 TaxID=2562283 RepID=UPI0010AC2BA7|nr:AmmeMemoRadiSam system protein A [Sinimarinibacterium sp. CAU 1509]TJY63278.1 AmmeMemoRadiSam system protein A [Sinimarinibacterium sp. CAU 1509]